MNKKNNKDDLKIGYGENDLKTSANLALTLFYDFVRDLTPVKTGKLKSSWTKSDEGVSNNCDYLYFVNNGTRFIKPRRFIERAQIKTEKELAKRMNKK